MEEKRIIIEMDKTFCDICGSEIKERKTSVFENTIYIRLGSDDKYYDVSDACDDCIIEFQKKFSKFIKQKKVEE